MNSSAPVNSVSQPVSKRTGHMILWLIVAAMLLPFALGTGLYFAGWQPGGKPSGDLVQPPRDLPAELLQQTSAMRGHWIVLLDAHEGCQADCARRLDEARRVHASLNKNIDRLRRAVVGNANSDNSLRSALAGEPDVPVLRSPTGWNGKNDTLYVIDPQGRIMMRYDPRIDARSIRTDLERLMRFS
jgi:hypothetical protein